MQDANNGIVFYLKDSYKLTDSILKYFWKGRLEEVGSGNIMEGLQDRWTEIYFQENFNKIGISFAVSSAYMHKLNKNYNLFFIIITCIIINMSNINITIKELPIAIEVSR